MHFNIINQATQTSIISKNKDFSNKTVMIKFLKK